MSECKIITHRGANKYAPQNTLHAFKKAVEIGTDGFETDVHITKDGEVVLCHNYTIDETSTGKGNIADKTLAELKSYDFGSYFSKKFQGTELPTLDEFLSFVETTDISVLNIEIKSPKENETAIVRKTIEATKNHGLFDRLLISSFDPKLLIEAKEIDPKCKTGFLYAPNHLITLTMFWRPVEFAKSIGADALHPQFLFVDKNYVKKAHEAGIMVNPWTVDDPIFIDKMLQAEVDGIITDLPDVVGGMMERYKD
ncbi:MAG: glycerophosphodiester phosphodiesterase [Clostridia bacterium]|nr:glycerophosphodiester phosphodiesterase [Clostridia bacterium]